MKIDPHTQIDGQTMPYPQTEHSMASIQISTTLKDKDGTYDRIQKAKPITIGSGTL